MAPVNERTPRHEDHNDIDDSDDDDDDNNNNDDNINDDDEDNGDDNNNNNNDEDNGDDNSNDDDEDNGDDNNNNDNNNNDNNDDDNVCQRADDMKDVPWFQRNVVTFSSNVVLASPAPGHFVCLTTNILIASSHLLWLY